MVYWDLSPTTPLLEDNRLALHGISEPLDRLGRNGNTPRVKAIAMEIDLNPGEAIAHVIHLVRSSALPHYHPCVLSTEMDRHLHPKLQSQALDRTDYMDGWKDAMVDRPRV